MHHGKKLVADDHTAPIPTANKAKIPMVAETLLNKGAHGKDVDPQKANVDALPDRIVESRNGRATAKHPRTVWSVIKKAVNGTLAGRALALKSA